MNSLKKKRTTLAAGTLVLVVAGGVAYAYWTNSGTGSGSATTGTNVALTVNQTGALTALAPGVPAQELSGTFTNTNDGPVFIKTVEATVTGTSIGGCTATDYTIAGTSEIGGAAPGAGGNVPAGSSGTWSGLTIAFNDKATNQDACKTAVVTIAYTTTTS